MSNRIVRGHGDVALAERGDVGNPGADRDNECLGHSEIAPPARIDPAIESLGIRRNILGDDADAADGALLQARMLMLISAPGGGCWAMICSMTSRAMFAGPGRNQAVSAWYTPEIPQCWCVEKTPFDRRRHRPGIEDIDPALERRFKPLTINPAAP